VTDVYAVLGWPVAHSRSPAMHNAALRALGLPGLYVPLAVPPEQLPSAIEALRELAVRGANVTLPHKSAIMALLDSVTDAARAVAAVNTVLARDGKLIGDNTDAEGLTRSLLENGVELAQADVVVLGAGGAARAAVYGLARAGARSVTIAARRAPAAEQLAADLRPSCGRCELRALSLEGTALAQAFASASLLVQSTSATLASTAEPAREADTFASALPLSALPKTAVVVDLVYKPLETAVLARAKTHGLRTVDGLGMLLHQGAIAFERFTGKRAPLEVMRSALLEP
jgi:shikimate dehydrogenase